MARGVFRSGNETHQRTEAFDGAGADKMKTINAGFESGAQQREASSHLRL